MQETANLKLKKPDLTDYVNVGDLNENADKIDTAITEIKDDAATHSAERGSLLDLETTDKTTIVGAINEVFQSGNSTKIAMVDALLLIDPSLPITQDSTWAEIELAVGIVSTGKKWKVGTVNADSSGITISGLEFKPSYLFMYTVPSDGVYLMTRYVIVYDSDVDISQASFRNSDQHKIASVSRTETSITLSSVDFIKTELYKYMALA